MKSADFSLPAGLFNRSPLDDHVLPGAAAAFSHLEFRSPPGRLPAGGSSGQVGRRALAGGEPPPARPGGLGRFRSDPAGRLCFSGAFLRFR